MLHATCSQETLGEVFSLVVMVMINDESLGKASNTYCQYDTIRFMAMCFHCSYNKTLECLVMLLLGLPISMFT